MKILAVVHEYPPIGGGAGMVLEALCGQLAHKGHEIDVVTAAFEGLPEREEHEGVCIHRIPSGRKRQIAPSVGELFGYVRQAAPCALEMLRRSEYDVIYGTCILPAGWVARSLHRQTGLPYALTTSGSDVPGHNPKKFGLLHRLMLPLWRRVVRDCAVLTCQSEYLAGRIRHAYGSQPPCLQVIPNGIDTGSMTPRPQGERTRRFLAVGRIEKAKGYQYLIQAMVGLDPDWALEIVGDGPYLPALKALARELGVPVTFHGWVDKAGGKLRELYETSSVFVHPSLAENFPTVVLEAMVAGLPLVTVEGTGASEVAGDAAVKVPACNAQSLKMTLERLCSEPQLREHLGRLAHTRVVEQFSWDRAAGEYAHALADASKAPTAHLGSPRGAG